MNDDELPRWADLVLLPLVNLALALAVAAGVMAVIGLDPAEIVVLLAKGAFGSRAGIGYTLYYATTFIAAGLAVAVAFHAGLFNIGGEGQALVAGLGVALIGLGPLGHAPPLVAVSLTVVAAMAAGAAWAAIPAALQAWRGSHVVITTIMFNFIGSALVSWLLVERLQVPGSMSVETAPFADAAAMPGLHTLLGALGIEWPRTPLNATLLVVLALAAWVGWWLWRSRGGWRLRVSGLAPEAAHYAGIDAKRQVMKSMLIAGACAGLVAVNELAGVQHRLLLGFVAGAGFAGIAVSLIGRNHPFGILLASLLFGALYQGGAELSFEVPAFTRDMVATLQGLIVLFSGALAGAAARPLARLLAWMRRRFGLGAAPAPLSGAPHG